MSGPRVRFADGQIDDVASVLVATSPRAADYLSQAPVLALLVCGKLASHVTYGEADAFAAKVSSGARLRDILASYGAPLPMRKIGAHGFRVKHRAALAALSKIDASTLSQIIPTDSQSVWLDSVTEWLRLTPATKAERARFRVAWIARRVSEDLSRYEQVSALVDAVRRGGLQINETWTWGRALAEVQAWHRRLNDERYQVWALRKAGLAARMAATFDTVICKANLPDDITIGGYQFVALRTLRKLREEGAILHHCVASYASDVKRGRCAIVSVRHEGVHIATLEIAKNGTVAQLKAHCNQAVSEGVRKAADLYALTHWRAPESAA